MRSNKKHMFLKLNAREIIQSNMNTTRKAITHEVGAGVGVGVGVGAGAGAVCRLYR